VRPHVRRIRELLGRDALREQILRTPERRRADAVAQVAPQLVQTGGARIAAGGADDRYLVLGLFTGHCRKRTLVAIVIVVSSLRRSRLRSPLRRRSDRPLNPSIPFPPSRGEGDAT